jgi:formamidopyrimidine-DNA glycosylase
MPELPEVDAIAGVARKYAVGGTIRSIGVLRNAGKYFGGDKGSSFAMLLADGNCDIRNVYRLGKRVVFELTTDGFMVIHNAMTGYLDWEHDPWTFDYVEGKRKSTDSDVRIRFHFEDGKVMRFHDARLFGSADFRATLPVTAPELMVTPNMMPGRPIMTLEQFYRGLQVETPVKSFLMDQEFLAGIGNIYASEACHTAGIDPRRPANSLSPGEVSVLHASLKWVVDHCIPQVRYDWLNVYRRASCMDCGKEITKVKLGGRSTFFCERCQR